MCPTEGDACVAPTGAVRHLGNPAGHCPSEIRMELITGPWGVIRDPMGGEGMDDVVSRLKDESQRGLISRRELLRRAALLVGGISVVGPLLEGCASSPTPSASSSAPAAPAATQATGAAPAAPAATAAPAAGAPKSGGTFTVGSPQEPDRLWGPFTGLTVAQEVALLVEGCLVRTDDELLPVPDLASEVPTMENGGISKDGLTYTFKLRKDVKWHDGKALTSKDVKFTYDVMVMKDTDVRSRIGWDQITSVDTPDDYTVIFKFKSIDAPFLDRVAITGILPQHVLGGLDAAAINKHAWFRAPMGTGPFKFKEWVSGDHVTLVKNPDYFKKGQPYLDQIVYKIVPDANALLNQLDTGEADCRFRLNNEHVEIAKGLKNATVISTPSVTPWLLWMNQTQAPFNDKSIRLALAYGIDKEGIAKTLLKGLVEPSWQLVSPLSWAYDPNVPKHKYDPAKAKQILDDAGWKMGSDGIREKDGKKLSFEVMNIAGEQERVQILSFAQRQWKDIGVDAKIKMVDVATMWGNALPKRTYEMAYSYTGRLADPDMSGWYMSPSKSPAYNYSGYSNPDTDKLLTDALQTVDQAKRKEIYLKVQQTVAEDETYLFLFWLTNHTVLNKKLKGYKPAPGYLEFWNADEWWLDK